MSIPTRLRRDLFALIWQLSEFSGIGLGRFAPLVFGQMIGRKGKRVEQKSLTIEAL